jgi:hypothetical protein
MDGDRGMLAHARRKCRALVPDQVDVPQLGERQCLEQHARRAPEVAEHHHGESRGARAGTHGHG